ncbi:MAG: type II toxin-antitoxin system VapC family toxin [Phycisphaerae bacterium]|nr:PIN domain-containing protein [Tepidisphaeraceae bacterium]
MILIDSAPLVALCDPSDQHHARASAEVMRLPVEPLVVCNPVLTEVCYHLPGAFLRSRLAYVMDSWVMSCAEDEGDPRLRADLLDWLSRYANHSPDMADGFLAVLAGRYAHAKVWTFDHEFETIWRRPDGSRIPLAARGR